MSTYSKITHGRTGLTYRRTWHMLDTRYISTSRWVEQKCGSGRARRSP